jgi:UDP-GlcNAc:undecaprenyl-phosphate GlcNAc-1-phosphate transferase
MLAAALLLHLMGLYDDRRPMGPRLKLALMLAAAAFAVLATDTRLDPLVGGPWLSALITIVWIAAMVNAMNFIDNMDGLSAGVGSIACAAFLTVALIHGQWFIAGCFALLLGALLGFLAFNRPPASIFMGDAGSVVLGFLLAFLSVRITYLPADPARPAPWHAVLTPLLVLAIPLYDFLSVTAIRLSQGRSPFVGDLQHFSHRLVDRGLTRPQAVLVIWGATAVTAIGGLALPSLAPWQAALVVAQTLVMLGVIALFEKWTRPAPR